MELSNLSQMAKLGATIPPWDKLLYLSGVKSQDPNFLEKVSSFKKSQKGRFFHFGKAIVRFMLHDPSIRKFVDSSLDEVVDIIAAQVAENNYMRKVEGVNDKANQPLISPYLSKSNRAFRQQPCTANTTEKRAKTAASFCDRDDPILLLGDDDMVGVALARAGFTDVTVLDIDPRILEITARVCQLENLNLRLFHHDLNHEIPDSYIKNYRLIFLDPDYSIPGVRTFLEAATRFAESSTDPIFFLSVHLMSLMKRGLEELLPLTQEVNLRVHEFYPSFNRYPVPFGVKSLIALVNRTITNSRVFRSEGHFPYFVSDALVLKRIVS